MDGIINIYKEKGFTSHDVVAKLRGILKQRKIGHTGTLDPDAEGVLPVCIGRGTKLCDLLTDKDKEYEAVLKLGITTDTQDMSGTVLKESPVRLEEDEIRSAILSFLGEYSQIPPMYSALKVNGKKLYELAREGIEVERKPRTVMIFAIDILEMDSSVHEIRIRINCSKGTYIRTLCNDIGEKLGTGGCMKSLLRTRVDCFSLEDSLRLFEIEKLVKEEKLISHIIRIEDMFPQYGSFFVTPNYDKLLLNGNPLFEINGTLLISGEENDLIKVYDSKNTFLGLYRHDREEKCLKPYKMFLQ